MLLRFLRKKTKDLVKLAESYRQAAENENVEASDQLTALYNQVKKQKEPPKIWVPIVLHTFLLYQDQKNLSKAILNDMENNLGIFEELNWEHANVVKNHTELFIYFLLDNPDMKLLQFTDNRAYLIDDILQKTIALQLKTAISIIHQSHIPQITFILLDFLYSDIYDKNYLEIIIQKINDLHRAQSFQNFQPIFWETHFNFLQTTIEEKLNWDSWIESKNCIAQHIGKALEGDAENQYILGNTYHQISYRKPEYTKHALYFLRLAAESKTKGQDARGMLDLLTLQFNDLLHQYHLLILNRNVTQLNAWIDSKEFKNFIHILREYPDDYPIVLDLLKADPKRQKKVSAGLQQPDTPKKSPFSFEFFSKKRAPSRTPLTLAQTLSWDEVCARDFKLIQATFADAKNPEKRLAGQKLEELYQTISKEIQYIETLQHVDQISPMPLLNLMKKIENTATLILRDNKLSKGDRQLWLQKLEMIYTAINTYVEKLCDYQNPYMPVQHKKNPK